MIKLFPSHPSTFFIFINIHRTIHSKIINRSNSFNNMFEYLLPEVFYKHPLAHRILSARTSISLNYHEKKVYNIISQTSNTHKNPIADIIRQIQTNHSKISYLSHHKTSYIQNSPDQFPNRA